MNTLIEFVIKCLDIASAIEHKYPRTVYFIIGAIILFLILK